MPGGPAAGSSQTPRRGARTLLRGVLLVAVTALVALAGLAGCGGEPPALTVGPVEYTKAELGALGSAQQEVLVDLTAFGLAVAEGRLETVLAPAVRRDLRSIVLQRLALELAAGESGVGEAELRRAYREDPRYELVVRHLVVLSERWRPAEHRDSARALAREALERVRSGAPFEALVAEYSDEPGAAERGGLLEPGRRGSWVPEFWQAASSLQEGETSPVVETEYGFHVIRLEERRTVPFEEVRDEVLPQVVDLPAALGRATDWASRRMALARLDSAAVAAWSAGEPVERPLLTWPDSLDVPPLTADWVRRYAETLAPGQRPTFGAGGAAASADFVLGVGQTYLLLQRAEAEGVEPTRSQRAAIRSRWQERAAGWATALGFRAGQSREAVKQAALEALGAPEQSVAIARSELTELRPVLRRLYPASSRSADAVNSEMSG